jgi:small subunit ribosomal protein S16
MLIIRYRRTGKRNCAQYKIVVAEKAFSVKGKFLEALGSYNPHSKEVVLKEDRINYWISVGAQCSDSVHNLLISKGLIKEAKRKVSFKGKPKAEGEEATAPVVEKKEEAVAEKTEVIEEEMTKEAEKVEEKKEEISVEAEEVVKEEIKEEVKIEEKTEEKPAEK